MSTAGPAWGDTARTQEASVLLEGAGLANAQAADDPQVFTDPQSLSFQQIDVSTGAQRDSMLLTVSDAGNGAGTWTVSLAPQVATNGVDDRRARPADDRARAATPRSPSSSARRPMPRSARTTGFIVLSSNGVQRRVPYGFLIERPALRERHGREAAEVPGRRHVEGAEPRLDVLLPGRAVRAAADYTGAPMNEDGSEHLYYTDLDQPVVNFGVSVLASASGALIDPFVLGSKNENDVQGYAGIPTDVNALTFDANIDVGAAGVQFPRLAALLRRGRLARRRVHEQVAEGEVPPERVGERRDAARRARADDARHGRPAADHREAVDLQSGVDPLSLVFAYSGVLIGASAYDPSSGLVIFGLPPQAPKLQAGKRRSIVAASDYQETKNINTVGNELMPNTQYRAANLTVVNGPTVIVGRATGIGVRPQAGRTRRRRRVDVGGRKVVFRDGGKQIAVDTKGPGGIFRTTWVTTKLKKGVRHLTATVFDSKGRTASRRPPAQDLPVDDARGRGRHGRVVRDRRRAGPHAARPRRRTSSASRAARRRRTSTRRATSPTARRSMRPPCGCSIGIRASTSSSATPASPPAASFLDGRRRADRDGDARQLPRHGVDDACVPARSRTAGRTW